MTEQRTAATDRIVKTGFLNVYIISIEHDLDVWLTDIGDEGDAFGSRVEGMVLEAVQHLDAEIDAKIVGEVGNAVNALDAPSPVPFRHASATENDYREEGFGDKQKQVVVIAERKQRPSSHSRARESAASSVEAASGHVESWLEFSGRTTTLLLLTGFISPCHFRRRRRRFESVSSAFGLLVGRDSRLLALIVKTMSLSGPIIVFDFVSALANLALV